jgi:hypothetical protein
MRPHVALSMTCFFHFPESSKERMFFFEKKKQKTFDRCRELNLSIDLKKQKFFASFFQKSCLLFLNRFTFRLIPCATMQPPSS